ncbi:hypothetical protein C8Q78DRAFT_1080343 [Trametes maxima]|nr:hypothetical protein C8Q78DRAFT_1080343 [Trametes maxima]
MPPDFSNPPPYWQPRQDPPPEDCSPLGHEGPPKWRRPPHKHHAFDDTQGGYPPYFPPHRSYHTRDQANNAYDYTRDYSDEQDRHPLQDRRSWAPRPANYYRDEEHEHAPPNPNSYSGHVPHDFHYPVSARPPRGSYSNQHRGRRGYRGGGYASHTSMRPVPGPVSRPGQHEAEGGKLLNPRAPDFARAQGEVHCGGVDLNTYMPNAPPKAPRPGGSGHGRIPDVDEGSAAARLARWEARGPDAWLAEAHPTCEDKELKGGTQNVENGPRDSVVGDATAKTQHGPDPVVHEGAPHEDGPTTDDIAAENTPSVPPGLPARDQVEALAEGRSCPDGGTHHITSPLLGPDISTEAPRAATRSVDDDTPVPTAPSSPRSTTPSRSYPHSRDATPPFFRSAGGSVCESDSSSGLNTEIEPAMAWRRGGGSLISRLREAKLDRLEARITALSAELEVLRLEMAQLKTESYGDETPLVFGEE